MKRDTQHESKRTAQLLLLGGYTAFVIGLITIILLFSWEAWAIPLVFGGAAICWFVHIRNRLSENQRLWLYSMMMMATFFYYGIHVTSTYDLALLMMVIMALYTVVGDGKFVVFCELTYFMTLSYNLVIMALSGTEWDSLLISRTVLHVILIVITGWVDRLMIRERNRVFRESDEQIEKLDIAAKHMNAFMSNISHELRTPVNAIMGTMEIALDNGGKGDNSKNMHIIREAAVRMALQVDDIMDYSEMETGRLAVNLETYSLASLLHDLLGELKPRIPDGIELILDVDAGIPSAMISDSRKLRKILFHIIGNSLKFTPEGGVYVHMTSKKHEYGVNLCIEVSDTGIGMDESEVERVMQQFYQTDTGKAVSTGGLGLGLPISKGFVRALGGFMLIESSLGKGTTVRISIPQKITDAQNCMSVENKEKINLGGYLNLGKFSNPYVREYYNDMILGTVQGLDIPMHRVDNAGDLKKLLERVRLTHLLTGVEEYLSAKDYIESLTDKIKVIVAAPDSFRLPENSRAWVLQKPLSGFSVASILNTVQTTAGDKVSRFYCHDVHALVVDDEPMNLTVASGILKKYGMEVDTISSGIGAVSLCKGIHFDIVFMDHMMPNMDGVEAMKHIRGIAGDVYKDVPIIALTANALSGAREMFIREGFDGFVSKPIEIPELERVLKRVLPKSKIGDLQERPLQEKSGLEDDQKKKDSRAEDDFRLELAHGGILVEEGMRYCRQDDELYASLLGQFAEDHRFRKQQLDEYLEQEDLTNYMIVVHALKSTAKMVGASKLSEEAKALEEAARSGDIAFMKEHHEELMIGYKAATDTIEALLRPRTQQDEDEVLEFFPDEDAEGGADL